VLGIRYLEEPGKPAPLSYIQGLKPADYGHLPNKIDYCKTYSTADWPRKWVEIIEDRIWELRQGDHRVLFFLTTEFIVVLHVFRKQSQNIKPIDIELARPRRDHFIAQGSK